MSSVVYEMKRHGSILTGREAGDSVYPDLKEALEKVPENGTLVLSFASVKMINTSFGDSCIGQLLVELHEGRHGHRKLIAQDIGNKAVAAALSRIAEIAAAPLPLSPAS